MERLIRRALVAGFLVTVVAVVSWMLYAASLREDSRANWVRRQSMPGGWPASIAYTVYGDFADPFELKVERRKHRCRGVPPGVEVRRIDAGAAAWQGPLDVPYLRKELARVGLEAKVVSASAAVVVRGTVPDRRDLGDLQDSIGVVSALLDQGGAAVLDVQALRWWTPAEWRAAFLEREGLASKDHVAILVSEGWVHTRGMRQFGRADVSVRGVAPGREPDALALANRLVDFQIDGGVLDISREIRLPGLPAGMRMELHDRPADFEDPDFANCRIEVLGFK